MKQISDKPGTFNDAALPAAAADLEGALNPVQPVPAEPETGFEVPRRIGMTIAALVFGVFGLWAVLAPIEGAVLAGGVITVKSYNQTIQHLEGGIVKEIRVQNGDVVAAGDVLLVLDPTQSAAQLEIANAQMVALEALEARLVAERDKLDAVAYPPSLFAESAQASTEIAGQNQLFTTRKNAHDGAIAVLEQRIGQLESRIEGLRAVRASKLALATSYEEELADLGMLLAEGFGDKLRLREAERSHAVTSGEAADLAATIASTEIQVGETRLEIIQLQNEFQTDVAAQLADTQTRLRDARERVLALRDVVARTEVRSPVAGVVNGLQVHTQGGVISPGSTIAEVVPQTGELVIEARVQPVDIDRVEVGQHANVRLSAFSRRSVPTLAGSVIGVSADSVFDQTTGLDYYVARVEIQPETIAALSDLTLVPGMPAEVFITTGSRTFLQYILAPITNVLARSFIDE